MFAQAPTPGGGWPVSLPVTVGAPPAPPVADYLPARPVEDSPVTPPQAAGQQHWISVNVLGGQPTAVRVGVKVWARENNSLWLEAYTGSALYDFMYGFGARVQHTAWSFANGDTIMVGPGLGGMVLPEWYADLGYRNGRGRWVRGDSHDSPLYFLTGDVDVSWLHDFTPRFGFELGVKLGLAGRVGGTVGNCYPHDLMWGTSLFPIAGVYTGLRF